MKTLRIFFVIPLLVVMLGACTDDGNADFVPEPERPHKHFDNPTVGATIDPQTNHPVPVTDRDTILVQPN